MNAIIQVVSTALVIIVFAIIIVIVFVLFCFGGSYSNGCCGTSSDSQNDDHHQHGDDDSLPRRTRGLSRAVIETFPTYMYSDVRVHRLGNGPELECAVCLNEFLDVEMLRLLPSCCHVFHPDCIDTWLVSSATCPVCRADVGSMSSLTDHVTLRSLFEASSDGYQSAVDIEQFPNQTVTSIPERMQITRIHEYRPKSHSTGHSPVWSVHEDRFTLRLPAEVRNSRGGRMALMCSKSAQ